MIGVALAGYAQADVFTDTNNDFEVLYFAYAGEHNMSPFASNKSRSTEPSSVIDVNNMDNYFDDVVQDSEQSNRHQQFIHQLAP